VSGNNLASADLSWLIPKQTRERWRLETVPEWGEVIFLPPAQTSLLEIASYLDFSKREAAGSIGHGWFCTVPGDVLRAPCLARHLLTWHSHPDGDCRFSFQDWLAFLWSDAIATCLFTVHAVRTLVKQEDGQCEKLCREIRGISAEHPQLMRQRALRLVDSTLGHSLLACTDEQIAGALGIDHRLLNYA